MYLTIADKQRRLDNIIIAKHNLIDEDLYNKKKIWLLVEVGELANELRFFKYASKNQEPRLAIECSACNGKGTYYRSDMECPVCWGSGKNKHRNPVLEEYVDCIHLLMSIYLNHRDFNYDFLKNVEPLHHPKFDDHFAVLFAEISNNLYSNIEYIFRLLIGVEKLVGFTPEEVLEAYKIKNKENLRRQDKGY